MRTILATALYVLPLYLEGKRKSAGLSSSQGARAKLRSVVLVTSLLFTLPQAIKEICSGAFPTTKGLETVFQ